MESRFGAKVANKEIYMWKKAELTITGNYDVSYVLR